MIRFNRIEGKDAISAPKSSLIETTKKLINEFLTNDGSVAISKYPFSSMGTEWLNSVVQSNAKVSKNNLIVEKGLCNGTYFDENKKNFSKKYYTIYRNYRFLLDRLLLERLPLKEFDNRFHNSDLRFVPVQRKDMDFYQFISNMELRYFYLRNYLYIEKLSPQDIELLLKLSRSEMENPDNRTIEIIEKTYPIVIDAASGTGMIGKACYGLDYDRYWRDSNELVFGFIFDEPADNGLGDGDEWLNNNFAQTIFINDLLAEISERATEILGLRVNFIRYNEFNIEYSVLQNTKMEERQMADFFKKKGNQTEPVGNFEDFGRTEPIINGFGNAGQNYGGTEPIGAFNGFDIGKGYDGGATKTTGGDVTAPILDTRALSVGPTDTDWASLDQSPDRGGSATIPAGGKRKPDPFPIDDPTVTSPVWPGGNQYGYMPVVGWLVCIEGYDRGRDYRLHTGYNTIGRNPGNDVCISADSSIARERQAMIAYDQEENLFFVAPGSGVNLIRLNGKVLMAASEIKANDILTLGSSKLMFIPFCSDGFNWSKRS